MHQPIPSVQRPCHRHLARPLSTAATAVALLLVGAASAEPAPRTASAMLGTGAAAELDRATPAQLQAAYLQCDRLASTSLLDIGTAAECGAVYEALKARVFGGDYRRLAEWWARQPRTAQPVAARSIDDR